MAPERHDFVAVGRVAPGSGYRLVVSVELGGFVLTDAAGRPTAYLSADNSRCVTSDRVMALTVRGRRFSWELDLVDDATGQRIAVASPKLRMSRFRIDDGSSRRLRLGRGLRATRWTLAGERGRIAHITIEELMRTTTRSSLEPGHDGRAVAGLTISRGSLRELGPVVMLAIATIRAEMTIPVLAGASG